MKPLIDALSKLLEKLFSSKTLWFVVVVAAILAAVLLLYGNGSLPIVGGCIEGDTKSDRLGLCTFIDGQKRWIGLIALVSIIMIGVKVASWVIKRLWDKLFVRPDSEPPA